MTVRPGHSAESGSTRYPDPKLSSRFRFVEHRFSGASGRLELVYAFDDGPELIERLQFPLPDGGLGDDQLIALRPALNALHLIAGVSYFKAGMPAQIDAGGTVITPRTARFLKQLYTQGLAELGYVNGLQLEGKIGFTANTGDVPHAEGAEKSLEPDAALKSVALVAMGGGKDSLVSLEMLRSAGIEVQPFVVGSSALIAETVRRAQLPLLRVERTLAPGLMQMNANGAFNGHVPVTAINSAIACCLALMHRHRWVVFSNERSASEATLVDDYGQPVNHQYSKSLDFERSFRALSLAEWGRIEYFSLLRPLSEAAVARRFSQLTQYHGVFSSCNRNFHQDGARTSDRWCGDCPKCRFTCLCMAPHLRPGSLLKIMGCQLLDEPEQIDGFRALCALGTHKPFECVGEAAESRALMAELTTRPEWCETAVVKTLAAEVTDDIGTLENWYTPSDTHCIPGEIMSRVAF